MKIVKTILLLFFAPAVLYGTSVDEIITIETKNTIMLFTGHPGKKFLFQFYGDKVNDASQVIRSMTGMNEEVYPAFGIECSKEKALQVTHSDGNMSADLFFKSVEKIKIDDNISLTKVILFDNEYAFQVTINYKTYFQEDIIEIWTDILNEGTEPVTLFKFASCYIPVRSFDPWLTHFHGAWGDEFNLVEEKLENGVKIIKNRTGIRNTQCDNPSFMLSLNGKSTEERGDIIAGTLAWTGNYKISFDMDEKYKVNITSGINEDASQFILERGNVFHTPKFILTYSNKGKGLASRNIHRWAREYKIIDGTSERMILLNSWEGVYFDITEDKILKMIDDFAELGGELFVMDDGWFGDKYPRNDGTSSLGDWVVNPKKLPNGLDPLIKRAEENGLKFGIWLEPEMICDKSELFERHPDWVVHQPNRTTIKGRGESQMLLDMSNPVVQDFVYHVVHDLLVKYPDIAYVKWDANHFISNYGSTFLNQDKQSHLYIEYHLGLQKTWERILASHPGLVMQASSSGGGRVTYGHLQYFQEFWTSDNTDALSRLNIQWGTSHFFPANAMASHVSASPNHQTNREIPLKFRFDVAMTGRLGMEMCPNDLTPEEQNFAKSAIETYKSIRSIIQQGDLYRIIAPTDDYNITSLMYVSPEKAKGVFFAFSLSNNFRYKLPSIKLQGLSPNVKYRITEINKTGMDSKLSANNEIFTGEFLMNIGIQISMNKVCQSIVVELVEVP